ncbi:septum formation initiator family protein [Candidatus Nomurabacteria bacterium]|nr:septum formation initiator family protein [Candidatus Nomurabacteria bacterium]
MHSRPVLAFLGILTLIFAWSVFSFMGKMEITVENRKVAENKVAELKKEKEKLSSDIAKLNTPGGIEESIRLKFGLAKEGENVIVVVGDENPPETKIAPSPGFFSFFEDWFK